MWLQTGGPGGSGRGLVFGLGHVFNILFQGKYDLIGFDPRGISETTPLVNCFGNKANFELFKKGTILQDGTELPPDPWSRQGREHLADQARIQTALNKAKFERCAKQMGEELRHMSTSTVVRDIDFMSTVLDGAHGRINYIGFSYGTILGAYLVNMLPASRLGRIAIDGVASAPKWSNEPTHTWLESWLVDTDKAFQWFLHDCSRAGPDACGVTKFKGEAPATIAHRLDRYLESLYETPISVPDAAVPGILTSAMARTVLYSSTNSPQSWQRIARWFGDAINGNVTGLFEARHKPLPSTDLLDQEDLSRAAVVCGDAPPQFKAATTEQLVDSTLAALKTCRRFGANVAPIEPDGNCEFHPAFGKTPERFSGPWNNTLEQPMLIVSNTADPITPRNSGEEIHKLMGSSSRILIQDSPGHCSVSSASPCTLAVYARYFVNGTLPKNHQLCKVQDEYFKKDQAFVVDETRLAFVTNEERQLYPLAVRASAAWSNILNI